MSYFPEPYTHRENKIKFELDLPNYARKYDLENATRVNITYMAKKADLASLKLDVEKLDIDKLANLPSDLRNLNSKI